MTRHLTSRHLTELRCPATALIFFGNGYAWFHQNIFVSRLGEKAAFIKNENTCGFVMNVLLPNIRKLAFRIRIIYR